MERLGASVKTDLPIMRRGSFHTAVADGGKAIAEAVQRIDRLLF
jgi:hypothetical protein